MSDRCPYCGTNLTSSLKFCVSCRRAVSDDMVKNFSPSEGFDEQVGLKSFKLSKKEYGFHRGLRSFFFFVSTFLMLFLVFFLSMKYVVKKPIPGEQEVTAIIKQITNPAK